MSDYYTLAPCPHCDEDCWKRMGGHHGIPIYYQCVKCGTDTNRIREALRRAREEGQ